MSEEEEVLLTARPARRYFFWWWVLFWLIVPAIVAVWVFRLHERHPLFWLIPAVFIIPGLVAITKRARVSLRVHGDRVIIERGILAKATKEIFISDIRTIDVKQPIVHRILGIGEITITTVGRTDNLSVIKGLGDPTSIKNLIIRFRQQAKAQARREERGDEEEAEAEHGE